MASNTCRRCLYCRQASHNLCCWKQNLDRMASVTCDGTRLEQLKTLAYVLAQQIDDNSEGHSMAQLARQYRETIKEIEELENSADDSDIISRLIAEGNSAG